MVDLLLSGRPSAELTENPKPVRTVYDPAAGTGGMLMGALHQITERNPDAVVKVYGQELNDETWAIAQSDLMMQDIDPEQMATATPSPPTRSRPSTSTSSSPIRPTGSTGRRYAAPDQGRAREARPLRPLRRRAAARLRRVAAVPAAHAVQDEADRVPGRHRALGLAAVLRPGGLRRVRDPALDPLDPAAWSATDVKKRNSPDGAQLVAGIGSPAGMSRLGRSVPNRAYLRITV